jgi:hypothetical protein
VPPAAGRLHFRDGPVAEWRRKGRAWSFILVRIQVGPPHTLKSFGFGWLSAIDPGLTLPAGGAGSGRQNDGSGGANDHRAPPESLVRISFVSPKGRVSPIFDSWRVLTLQKPA